MKVTRNEIEKACGTKDIRPCMNAPFLDVERKRLVASDGHIAAVVPVEIEAGDHTGGVPIEALKRARKACGRHSDASLKLNGRAELDDGSTMPRPDAGVNLSDAIERISENMDAASTIELCFDAGLLKRLADALCDAGDRNRGVILTVRMDGDGKVIEGAMRVQPRDGDANGRFGIIMPMRR